MANGFLHEAVLQIIHLAILLERLLHCGQKAPIEFGMGGSRRWARIPGVLDIELQGIRGRAPNSEVWIDNVGHPVAGRLAAARATRSSYRDHAFSWDNTGRNGHYAGFEWSGP